MVNYKDLGLVNTREMFAKAIKGGYAIPAFNFNNMEQMQAIIKAAVETKSPVILQVSKGARQYANATLLRYMAQGAVEYAKELGCAHPEIVLHLDHGDTFETCKSCIDSGFSSVMIDGSHLPYEENVALTKKVVEYAHQFDVTVEGELGVLAGVEDEVSSDHHTYTDPEEVIDFATRTGCDSLAISIGTSHGAYKFTPEQCHIDPKTGRMVPPPLAFEVLDAVMEKLPGFPIVLHGSSSVPEEEVETINKYGGALKAAIGIPEEELRKAAKSAVCKINIAADTRRIFKQLIFTILFIQILQQRCLIFGFTCRRRNQYLDHCIQAVICIYQKRQILTIDIQNSSEQNRMQLVAYDLGAKTGNILLHQKLLPFLRLHIQSIAFWWLVIITRKFQNISLTHSHSLLSFK